MGASLGGFDAAAKKIITTLEGYGWVFEVSSKGHAVGKAPDGETTTSIARRLTRANRSQQNAEAVVKRWERQMEAQALTQQVGRAIDSVKSGPITILDEVVVAGATKKAEKAMRLLREAEPEPRVTEVSRAPWLARQGTHREKGTASLYESHAVQEVTWSDGSLSYACAKPDCDYVSENPRSVSSHFRAHVRAGEAEPVGALPRPSVAKDVPVDPETIGGNYPGHGYKPTERLLQELAEWLAEQSWDNVDDLARLMLTWSHDRRGVGSLTEPLTDGQILARIRLLVGGRDPEMEEAHRNALATIERLTVEHEVALAEVTERLDAAAREVVRLTTVLDTLSSLAREEGAPRLS